MTFQEMAIEIAKREGGKESLSIAQISEVLSIVSDIMYECYTEDMPEALRVERMLFENGKKRKENN